VRYPNAPPGPDGGLIPPLIPAPILFAPRLALRQDAGDGGRG
jgi:hypothetical protein